MCTLIAAVNQFSAWPLVVAANRDERLDRAASGPRLWEGEVPFIAPRDEVAGGTWLGLNAGGVFVGITNRFGVPNDTRRQSRGTLVTEALRHPTAESLHRELTHLSPERFNAFHLFYADRAHAFVTWCDGKRVLQEKLAPGVHIVTERSLGGDDRARTELIRKSWATVGKAVTPTVEQLGGLMRLHQPEEPVGSTCVHVPSLNYGTRSSMLLFLGERWNTTRMLWAEGSPCQVPYVEQNHLVAELTPQGL